VWRVVLCGSVGGGDVFSKNDVSRYNCHVGDEQSGDDYEIIDRLPVAQFLD